jgi:hypothetical protein
MRVLEIIHLRAAGSSPEALGVEVFCAVRALGPGVEAFACYRKVGLDTDFAIHVRQCRAAGDAGPSELGLRLADALRDHGLVDHTVWAGIQGDLL